jgi:hypothetical protein
VKYAIFTPLDLKESMFGLPPSAADFEQAGPRETIAIAKKEQNRDMGHSSPGGNHESSK